MPYWPEPTEIPDICGCIASLTNTLLEIAEDPGYTNATVRGVCEDLGNLLDRLAVLRPEPTGGGSSGPAASRGPR